MNTRNDPDGEGNQRMTRDNERAVFAAQHVVSFVQGAQWWEYHKTGATLWPSDRDQAEAEAEKRARNGTLGKSPNDK